MAEPRNSRAYAAKMREHVERGTDFEVDVRFIDMLVDRNSRILDVGSGIGNAVNGLRARGHDAYGVDPSSDVLGVAADLYDRSWFRPLSAAEISRAALDERDLPRNFDLVLMSGNVPASSPSWKIHSPALERSFIRAGTSSSGRAHTQTADHTIRSPCMRPRGFACSIDSATGISGSSTMIRRGLSVSSPVRELGRNPIRRTGCSSFL